MYIHSQFVTFAIDIIELCHIAITENQGVQFRLLLLLVRDRDQISIAVDRSCDSRARPFQLMAFARAERYFNRFFAIGDVRERYV